MEPKTWKVQMTYHLKIDVGGLTSEEGPTEEECREVIRKQIEDQSMQAENFKFEYAECEEPL